MLLHLIDLLDTRMHMVLRELTEDRNNPSAWTPYNANLGRRFYKGGPLGDLYSEAEAGTTNRVGPPRRPEIRR